MTYGNFCQMKNLFCLILRVVDPAQLVKAAGSGRAGVLGLATGLIAVTPVWAAPSGGQLSGGSGSIERSGATTTVLQTSGKLAIDWRGFDVGAAETVRFVQPNSGSVVLNRVLGGDASVILGRIEANGQVFLINPNGILFGRGAQVDVGGLVASTLQLSDADFMAGRLRFDGGGKGGAVRNEGVLRAADGGYIALLGGQVDNSGTLVAKLGSVAMAAGNLITLDFHGDGMLKVAVEQGALASMAGNGGAILADGGRVLLTAKAAGQLAAGAVNNTGLIQARTLYSRNGVIELLGDMRVGSVAVAGVLDASAAAGDGGHIETSAARVAVADGVRVDTGAAAGRAGGWLIDPADFTIAASGGNISGAALSSSLGVGNVTIVSSAGTAGGGGDVHVNDAVSWSANQLTLTAARDVRVNATMSATGSASLTMNTASANGADAAVAGGTVRAGLSGNSFTGRIDFSGSGALTINTRPYTVLSNVNQLQAISANLAGYYALGANIDASATAGWNGGAGFLPLAPNSLPPFSGQFDGLGHTISGLTMSTASPAQTGMFGVTTGAAAVRNVGLAGGAISGAGQVGALIGVSNGRVDNVWSSASVTGSGDVVGGLIGASYGPLNYASHHGAVSGMRAVGGLVGSNQSSVNYAVNAGTVNGNNATGGIVGNNPGGSVLHSSNAAAVTGSASDVGGIVGDNNGTVSDDHNTGTVHGASRVGGVTGMNYYGGVISDSDNAGQISGTLSVGGLSGFSFGIITRSFNTGNVSGNQTLGGVSGTQPSGTISLSYSTGSVTGTGNTVGGLVGDSNSVIVNSYATGAVSGVGQVGGLVGLMYTNAALSTSFSSGAVSGSTAGTTGGLVGQGMGTVTNGVWDRDSSGRGTSGGGVGVSSAAMRQSATFSGWNLSTQGASGAVWRLYEGQTVPLLRNFLTPLAVSATPVSAIYDGNGHSGPTGVQYTGFTGGDTATSGSLSWGTAINAGSYSLTGLWSTKYDIAYTGGVLTVAPRMVDLSGGRVYNGSASVAAGALALGPLVGGEQLGLSGAGTLAGKNVGTGLALGIGSLALANGANGGLASNYTLVGGNRSATITPAALTASGIGALNKVYDGNATASLDFTGAVLNGVVGGDAVALQPGGAAASFANANVGPAKPVTFSALPLTGADAGNYTLAMPTLSGSITPYLVNLSGARVYDGSASAAAAMLAFGPLVGSETLNLSGAGALASKHIGSALALGLGSLALANGANGGLASNYTLVGGTRTVNVTPAPLTVGGVSARDKVYDGGTAASLDTAGAVFSGVLGADVVALAGGASAAFGDRHVGAVKPVGITALPLGGADGGDYTLATPTGLSAAITPYLVNLSGSRVYDGGNSAAAAILALGPLVGGETLNLSGAGTLASKHIGNNLALGLGSLALADGANGGLASNYTLNGGAAGVSVTPATLTVSGLTARDKVYDGATAASLDTSGAVLGGVLGVDAVALAGGAGASFADRHVGNAKPVTIGTLALSGTDAGDYVLAAPGTLSAAITPYVVHLSGSRVYNGGTDAAAGSLTFGPLVAGETLNLSGAGTLAGKHVGSALAVGLGTLALADGGNGGTAGDYTLFGGNRTLTVTPAALTVGGIVVQDKVYDGSAGATLNLGAAALSGVLGMDAVALQAGAAAASFGDRHAGVGKSVTFSALPLSGADAANYVLAAPGTLSATISPRLVNLSGSRVYNGGNGAAAGVFNMGALVGGEGLNLSGTGTLATKHIGNNLAVGVGSLTLADGANGGTAGDYTLSGASLTLNVTPAGLTVSGVTARNKVYDGGSGALLDTAGATLGGVIGSDLVAIDPGGATASFADRHAGNGKAVTIGALPLTGADAGDYTLANPTGLSANITPYVVNLSGTRVYDASASAAAAILALGPLVGGETLNLSGAGTLANKHIGTNLALGLGSLALTDGANGGLAGNYTLAGGVRTVNVTPAQLTVSGVSARNKVYDGAAAASLDTANAVFSGVLGTDVVALAGGAGATFADRHVGNGKAVAIAALPLGGADGGDYRLTAPSGLSAAITPYVVNLSGSRVYDGGNSAAAGVLNLGTLVGSETLNLSGAGTLASKHVGNTLSFAPGTLALANGGNGGLAANYTLSGGSRSLSVTAAPLTLSGVTARDRVYDGGTGAGLNLGGASLNGVLGNDAVALPGGTLAASFADRHAGVAKTVTLAPIALSGADAGDYALALPSGLQATISPYLINLSGSRVYDGSNDAAAGLLQLGALVGAEQLNLFGSGLLAGKNVGGNLALATGTLVLANGANGGTAGDYTLFGGNHRLSVTPATLTVSGLAARDKVYDGNNGAGIDISGAVLGGVVGGDDVALPAGPLTASFADRHVGAVKAVGIAPFALAGADVGNYVLTGPGPLSAAITPFVVNLSGTRVYDGGDRAAAAILQMGALVGAERLTLSGAGILADKRAGAHTGYANGTLSLGDGANGGLASNYTLSGGALQVDVVPAALTVTGLTARDKTYDGTTRARLDGTTATLSGVVGADAVTVHADTSVAHFGDARAGAGKTVSIGSVGLTGADAGNYVLAGAPSVTATINPYLVRLVGSRRYDAGTTAAAGLFGLAALVGDEQLSLSGMGTVASKNVGSAWPVALGSLALGDGANGGLAANYMLSGAASTLSITPAPLTLGGLSALDKVYDGGTDARVDTRRAALAGVLGGDEVSLQADAVSASFGDRRAGAGKRVEVGGLVLAGQDSGNYTVLAAPALTASITPASVEVTGIKATDKIYDGGTGATLDAARIALQGVIGNDEVTLGGDWSARFADKHAGRGKTVTAFGLAMTGADAGNYVLRDPLLQADITPAVLTVSALDQTKRIGAADPAPAYRGTALIGNDQLAGVLRGSAARAPGEEIGRYRIGQGSLASGDANYTVNFIPGSLLILPPEVPDSGLIEASLRNRHADSDAMVAAMSERERRAAGFTAKPATVATSIFGSMTLRVVNGGLRLPQDWQPPR